MPVQGVVAAATAVMRGEALIRAAAAAAAGDRTIAAHLHSLLLGSHQQPDLLYHTSASQVSRHSQHGWGMLFKCGL